MFNRSRGVPIVANIYISGIGCLLIIGVTSSPLRISIAILVGI